MNGRDLFHLEYVADEEGDDEQQDANENGPGCEKFLLRRVLLWNELATCLERDNGTGSALSRACACRAGGGGIRTSSVAIFVGPACRGKCQHSAIKLSRGTDAAAENIRSKPRPRLASSATLMN